MSLPNGWKKVKLGQIMSFKNGLNFSQVSNGKELNFLGVANFKSRKFISSETQLDKIYLADFPNDDYLLKANDLVFVRSNGSKDLVGRCVKMNNSFSKTTFSGFCIRGRLSSSETSADYILHFIECGFLKDKLRRESRGTNISNLNQDILDDFDIMLPPLEEQKKIAATLSVWDSAIEKMEKLIEALEEKYQSYVNEFFFENQNDKQKLKMGDIFAVRNDRSVATGDMPLYSLTIENGITAKTDRYDRGALVKDKDSKKYKIVCDGDIVYNPANLRWGAIGQSKVGHNVVVSPIYEVLYARDNCNNSRYLSHYIMSKKMIAFYSSKTEGTLIERKEVKIDQFLRIDLYIEKDPVRQKKIADVLDLHQEEISNLKQQLENYKKQKQGLMQKLLTGQWRVK